MQTLVFGIDSLWEQIEPGFPLLYPLLREKKLVLLSSRDDAPDPTSSVATLDCHRGYERDLWQAIILIPDRMVWRDDHVSLSSFLHQIEQQQLTEISERMGSPENVWVLSLDRQSPESTAGIVQFVDRFGFTVHADPASPWLYCQEEINSLDALWEPFSNQLINSVNAPNGRHGTLHEAQKQLREFMVELSRQKVEALPAGDKNSFFNEARYLSVVEQFNVLLAERFSSWSLSSVSSFSPGDLLKGVLRDNFSLFAEQFEKWLVASINDADWSTNYKLPYLISTLAQWDSNAGQSRERFWRIEGLSVDANELTRSANDYRNRLEQILKQVQDRISAPLTARMALLEKPSPQSATKFAGHEELHPPVLKSSPAWADWKEQTRKFLADYQEKGKALLATLGEELRQGRGREDKRTIEDVDKELKVAEEYREATWQKFRHLQHRDLTHDWDASISRVEYRLLELFLCRPTQMQRWVTAFVGLLLFLMPVAVFTATTGWTPNLYQRTDFIVTCSVIPSLCLVIVLLLYIRYRLILRRLCRSASETANNIFKKINSDTEDNVTYLLDLFKFSVAEQNLRRLRQVREELQKHRSRWIWFETEVRKHLHWGELLCPERGTQVGGAETDMSFNFDFEQASHKPCSYTPIFSLPVTTRTIEILVQMGSREERIEIESLPGISSLHLVKDIF